MPRLTISACKEHCRKQKKKYAGVEVRAGNLKNIIKSKKLGEPDGDNVIHLIVIVKFTFFPKQVLV